MSANSCIGGIFGGLKFGGPPAHLPICQIKFSANISGHTVNGFSGVCYTAKKPWLHCLRTQCYNRQEQSLLIVSLAFGYIYSRARCIASSTLISSHIIQLTQSPAVSFNSHTAVLLLQVLVAKEYPRWVVMLAQSYCPPEVRYGLLVVTSQGVEVSCVGGWVGGKWTWLVGLASVNLHQWNLQLCRYQEHESPKVEKEHPPPVVC